MADRRQANSEHYRIEVNGCPSSPEGLGRVEAIACATSLVDALARTGAALGMEVRIVIDVTGERRASWTWAGGRWRLEAVANWLH